MIIKKKKNTSIASEEVINEQYMYIYNFTQQPKLDTNYNIISKLNIYHS